MHFDEFCKRQWLLSAYLFNQVIGAGEHPILVVDRDLTQVLPKEVVSEFSSRSLEHCPEGGHVFVLIPHGLSQDLA